MTYSDSESVIAQASIEIITFLLSRRWSDEHSLSCSFHMEGSQGTVTHRFSNFIVMGFSDRHEEVCRHFLGIFFSSLFLSCLLGFLSNSFTVPCWKIFEPKSSFFIQYQTFSQLFSKKAHHFRRSTCSSNLKCNKVASL